MTVDELRTRKRELQAKLEREEDALALSTLREELLDVSAHLKALTGGSPKRPRRVDAASYTKDHQQYLNWRREDTALDDENDDHHARMRQAAVNGMDLLPPRQRETLEMYLAGKNMPAIAAELGVNCSTVSRNIRRAKKNLREETERAMEQHKLLTTGAPLADSLTVDLWDPAAARAVLLALTPMQAVYFYLYYSECLPMPEIAALTGTNRSTVSRTCRRALRRIGVLLGGQDVVLEHPEALGELAYQAYCRLGEHPELLTEALPAPVPGLTHRKQRPGISREPPAMCCLPIRVRQARRGERGKLLSALLERQGTEDYPQIHRWLEVIFAVLLNGLQRPGGRPCISI